MLFSGCPATGTPLRFSFILIPVQRIGSFYVKMRPDGNIRKKVGKKPTGKAWMPCPLLSILSKNSRFQMK